jgi:peroxiredoxin
MRVRLLFALSLLALFGVAVAAEDKKVEVGKPAPAIKLPAANIETALPDKKDAKELSLKDFEGKKNVVLFFFPKALTKG